MLSPQLNGSVLLALSFKYLGSTTNAKRSKEFSPRGRHSFPHHHLWMQRHRLGRVKEKASILWIEHLSLMNNQFFISTAAMFGIELLWINFNKRFSKQCAVSILHRSLGQKKRRFMMKSLPVWCRSKLQLKN